MKQINLVVAAFLIFLSGCSHHAFDFENEEIRIMELTVDEISDSSARITFLTSKKGTTEIYYRRVSSVEKIDIDDNEILDHSVTLTSLVPQSDYYCRIISQNEDGYFCETDTTFTTKPYPETYPENHPVN